MSTTIDQRVVEMRFDNKQFESNVSTTMSTLEKLKSKLNFTNSAKGLGAIGDYIKKIGSNRCNSSCKYYELRSKCRKENAKCINDRTYFDWF